MPSARIIAAIMGAALLVGAVVSGCNRNRDVSAANSRRPAQNAVSDYSDLAQAPMVSRPAEVLAATVRRPQRNRPATPDTRRAVRETMYHDYYQPGYPPASLSPQSAAELARYEPLPEPVPVADLYGRRNAYASQPARPAPIAPVVHPSPELAMARAALMREHPAPASVPAQSAGFVVPPIEPYLFSAPIPELEPVRYQRVAAQTRQRQSRSIHDVSAVTPAAGDARRALEPLGRPVPSPQGWVPSPVTAMGD